eukprot:1195851-Prorocentrum_minimum.AAC.26
MLLRLVLTQRIWRDFQRCIIHDYPVHCIHSLIVHSAAAGGAAPVVEAASRDSHEALSHRTAAQLAARSPGEAARGGKLLPWDGLAVARSADAATAEGAHSLLRRCAHYNAPQRAPRVVSF